MNLQRWIRPGIVLGAFVLAAGFGVACDTSDEGGTDVAAEQGADTTPVSDTAPQDLGLPDTLPELTPYVGRAVDCEALETNIKEFSYWIHLFALAQAALAGDGNRASGTAGWDGSVAYVRERLTAMGYPTITSVPAEYPYYEILADPMLERLWPTTKRYAYAKDDFLGDFQRVNLSQPGDVTAAVTPVALDLGPGNHSASGCDLADFDGFPAGNIALIQRGTCPLVTKAWNAQLAGADAVVFFNQGNTEDRMGLNPDGWAFLDIVPTQAEHGLLIPGVFATYEVGRDLATQIAHGTTVKLRVKVSTVFEVRQTESLVVETAEGDPEHVILIGAHLDSVRDGFGINDNATGVAAVLELARIAAACHPDKRLRFAFWGGEEWGSPWGSMAYTNSLRALDLAKIKAYLNVDTLGSRNYAIHRFDGNGSELGTPGDEASGRIERLFVLALMAEDLWSLPEYAQNSDQFYFMVAGVPFGYLTTGDFALKTRFEAQVFGGKAAELYDDCHHQSCDGMGNVDLDIARRITRAYARVMQALAF